MKWIGWALYLISWITPSVSQGGIGARAFLAAVEYGTKFVFHPQSPAQFVLGLCLLLGWLANFSIFIPLSARARVVWSVAPWLPFVGTLLLADAPASMRQHVFSLLYFYPWAIGIACIHIGMMYPERRGGIT